MKNLKAMSLSTIIMIIVTVIITIFAELSKPFKDFLAGITGHHWVTKSLVAMLLFLILSFVFARKFKGEVDVWKETKRVIWTAIIGTILIFGFFVLDFFV